MSEGSGFRVRVFFFFSSRRRHTRCSRDWSSDVCSSDLIIPNAEVNVFPRGIALALIAVGLCAPAPARAQQTGREKEQILWQKLEANVQEVDRHLDGVIGVALLDLATRPKYFLHAHDSQP